MAVAGAPSRKNKFIVVSPNSLLIGLVAPMREQM
jgi:hypothetical protein